MTKYLLKLFILGQSSMAKKAIKNLENICKEPEITAHYNVEIIDLYEHPECAEQEKILATPLLIIQTPLLQRRIIGDLSNTERVLAALSLDRINYENEF